MLRLDIIQPITVGDPLDDLAERPFLHPGSLHLSADRKVPRWIPGSNDCLYLAPDGALYGFATVPEGTRERPRKRADLAEIVFGRKLLSRYAHTDHAGFIFDSPEPKSLAACVADDAELDLPVEKAQRLIAERQRIYLGRRILGDALAKAVHIVGRENARVRGKATSAGPSRVWSLRTIFGTIR